MAWEFHVGQRVVCADARGTKKLVEGRIYTISQIFPFGGYSKVFGVCMFGVRVSEAVPDCGEVAFAPPRFRPLRERKTDISVFRALLNTNEKKVDA